LIALATAIVYKKQSGTVRQTSTTKRNKKI